ncbi:beta-ketoacyl-[acyl-carrier-protein] synthase family protein [Paenibacillus xylaniclasticus]|uniref:beta-ketoacyl-[acyl-carrier-protein] synthase family protein n=1 Tax=Paenibacillus xylaniclasticus TaxID=588083 RepID=UPI000FDB8D45|nr:MULTISPECIES: beta-ketoacyl synthase N-terminal-like domain-containing protein [Paenibacillus]GFN29927.1 3-oxoacyl-[acyl-carrier-protein] synthase 2 [Paenibacillus curdlanolyticus]
MSRIKQDNDIVITGIGLVSSAGNGLEELTASLQTGSAHRSSLREHAAEWSDRDFVGATVRDWNPEPLLGKKGLQFMHAGSQYLLGASLLALRDAGLEGNMPNPDDLGIVIGTNLGGLKAASRYDYTAATQGPRYVSPMEAPNTLANSPASYLAIRVQARACNTTISTGQCSSLDAIGYAANLLRKGRAKTILVGGVEELNAYSLWVYNCMNVLPDEGADAIGRPFDAQSAGWVPGEGAAVIVLERRVDAVARGAEIVGEIAAWSSAFRGGEHAAARASALERAMRQSLHTAGIVPEEVSMAVTGAVGHPAHDEVEALALRAVLGDNPPPVCAAKGLFGETYGAGGLLSLAAAAAVGRSGVLPESVGYAIDPAAPEGLSGIVHQSGDRAVSGGAALLSAHDYHGMSSAVVLRVG